MADANSESIVGARHSSQMEGRTGQPTLGQHFTLHLLGHSPFGVTATL